MWHDIQSEFSDAISDATAPTPHGIIASTEQFNIYRNNVAVSLNDALAQTFPVVKMLVGDEFFTGMAQVYVQQNKPTSPLLMEYGDTFSDFIQAFPPAAGIAYLSDTAALEFAWLRAYHARDANPLAIDVLSTVPEDALDDLTFKMHPSLFLITSDWPVASIWHAHQNSATPDLSELVAAPEFIMIVRPEMDVNVLGLTEASFAFADALDSGMSLGAACEALEEIDGFDPSQHLTELFMAGAITDVITNT